jgi:hypothetical protein
MSQKLWRMIRSQENNIRLGDDEVKGNFEFVNYSSDYRTLSKFFYDHRYAPELEKGLPSSMPPPILKLPSKHFDQDFISGHLNLYFVSARMREAMALPEEAVQYVKAEVITASATALAQDYHLMIWKKRVAAFDYARIRRVGKQETKNRSTDPPLVSKYPGSPLVFFEDFASPTDLFCDIECNSVILVSDALAQRVLDAGCTGVWFQDPDDFHENVLTRIIKTKTGRAKALMNMDNDRVRYEPIPE